MRQRRQGQRARHRELLAAFAIAAAVGIVAVAVPLLAVREERGTAGEIVPSLPVLVLLSAVSIGLALVALYRLAAERAGTRQGEQALEQSDAHPLEVEGTRHANGSTASAQSGAPVVSPVREAQASPAQASPAPVVEQDQPPVAEEVPAGPDLGVEALPARRRPNADRTAAAKRRPAQRAPRPLERQQELSGADESASGRGVVDEPRAPLGTEGADATETCEIVWWHGANKGGFEARMNGGDRRARVVGRSRTISWRERTPPPPGGAAAEAHRILVEKLAAEGWLESHGGSTWYGARFVRSTGGSLDESRGAGDGSDTAAPEGEPSAGRRRVTASPRARHRSSTSRG